jgi:Cu(I)/Ag(I) efflux system membrane fusion protein
MSRKRRLVVIGSAVAGVVALAVLHRPLIAWFSGGDVSMGKSASTAAKASAGELALELALKPDPPRQERNALVVVVKDEGGAPIDDADVAVEYRMPAMGAMSEMTGTAKVDTRGGGEYRAVFDLPMAGSWTLTTRVRSPRGNGEVRHGITVGRRGLTLLSAAGATGRPATLSPLELSPQALAHVQEATAALETVRARLAADTLDGVADNSARVANMLRAAKALVPQTDVQTCLADAARAADALSGARDIAEARKAFAATTSYFVALAAADPRLKDGWRVFECPMVEGFNKWLQRGDVLENPYMGKKMLSCGSASTFTVSSMPAHDHAAGDPDEVEYYTCSMHPSVKQEQPGTCPICSMNLTPVTKGELESGVVIVDDVRRQKIGVKTAVVERRRVGGALTTVGRVVYDEEELRDITLKFGGFVEELLVDETGQKVTQGQTLFQLYSPELYSAQLEYLQAKKAQQALGMSDFSASLARSARRRLELWDLGKQQIAALEERGEATDRTPIVSPVSGYVIEKHVVDGAKVEAGMTVYRVADLDEIWVEADVYEAELPRVALGQRATITLPYQPGKELEGKVAFIYPFLESGTRTGRVRVELKNPGLGLKPEMYANVALHGEAQELLAVPESAVVYTGARRLVFIDLGEGRLKPVEVKLGDKADGYFKVLDGLKQGDVVVTSGNFLIAAESRLKGAAAYWAHDVQDAGGPSSKPAASSQPSDAPSESSRTEATSRSRPTRDESLPATKPVAPAAAAPVVVIVSLSTDPPAQRGNVLVVEVEDAGGRPLGDAVVDVAYRMPPMGSMAEMKGTAKVEKQSDGRFLARFDLPMSGSWTITTTVKSSAGTRRVAHAFTVGKTGLTPVGKGGDDADR